MKNILLMKKSIPKYILIITLFLISIGFACTYFSGAYVDFWNALINGAKRIVIFFSRCFGGDINTPLPPNIAPPVPDINIGGNILPTTPSYLGTRFNLWGNMLITGDMYYISSNWLTFVFSSIIRISLILIPLFYLSWNIIKKIYFRNNTKHGHKTIPQQINIKLSKFIYTPIKTVLKNTYMEFKERKWLKYLLITMWMFNFNIATILLKLISFYFYFVVTFNIAEIYYELVDILVSLKYFATASGIFILIVTYCLFLKWRTRYAINKLEELECHNKEVLKNRDISTFNYGPMGCGKTALMTDQALSLSVMDSDKAAELMLVCRKMFPYFPWLLFELDIETKIKNNCIINWATCIDFIEDIETNFQASKNLYDYDYCKYGLNYYNGVVVNNLFMILKDYIRLYMLYISVGSHIISNYPIREDRVPFTAGNSLRWDNSFFAFDIKKPEDSYYSKILDFDLLRMRKKMRNILSNDSLEFGIIVITEDDKEQKNAVETLKESADSPFPSPKNDGMTLTEKYIRHRSTIMGHCFIHILKDGQRVMSINADTREISTVQRIVKDKKERNALPFFKIDKAIYMIWNVFFSRFEDDMRFCRGDDTLLMHIFKSIDKFLYNSYYRKYNRYTYRYVNIEAERGTLDSSVDIVRYNLINAKIYANRYNTATHEEFFYERARKSGTGITKYKSYTNTRMTVEELLQQQSYSALDMYEPNWRDKFINEKKMQDAIELAERKAIVKNIQNSKRHE